MTGLTHVAECLKYGARSAGIAQLVERNLAKVEVASSSLVSRSRYLRKPRARAGFLVSAGTSLSLIRPVWPSGRVVMQRIANPWTSVRFRPRPPLRNPSKYLLLLGFFLSPQVIGRLLGCPQFGRNRGVSILFERNLGIMGGKTTRPHAY